MAQITVWEINFPLPFLSSDLVIAINLQINSFLYLLLNDANEGPIQWKALMSTFFNLTPKITKTLKNILYQYRNND